MVMFTLPWFCSHYQYSILYHKWFALLTKELFLFSRFRSIHCICLHFVALILQQSFYQEYLKKPQKL